ncbi:type II toxin-antitoxin system RelE/ParE family toxin [Anabaena sp. UHCC 0399]|uniref:type II toxin-antitoxin system RelE family toxin n=1 Tax=Anabaena sp. UHCC 0399 TaxID=3110238 RepID=UPI002B1F8969|nr:type II toxin-antitoxin system RelE/ParE family toxin [Anabaena sp. UHCC 0399]MEA5564046.1 type II toxin-antitoxin system RelE/ParE family toxin [Anabaena sp. UHCC 0399]
MTYQIEFTEGANKQLKKLPSDIKERIDLRIQELAIDPSSHGVKKLADEDYLYRIRVGDYRVIYQILDTILLVTVIKVKHRSHVYKD